MNYDPVEVVINMTVNTFGLREWAWDVEDFVEDIAEALKLIGAAKVFENCVYDMTINSMMGKLPPGCQNVKHLLPVSFPFKEQGGFLIVDVPDGTVVQLAYQGMPLDTRGYPVVPDNAPTRQAIMWWLARILVLQGIITRVTFNQCEAEWQWRCGSARADLSVMNLHEWNKVSNNYLRLNPLKDQHAKDYAELGKPNTLDREKIRLGRYRDLDDGYGKISSEQKPD